MTPTKHRLPRWKQHQLMLSKLDTVHSSCSVLKSWSYFKATFWSPNRVGCSASVSVRFIAGVVSLLWTHTRLLRCVSLPQHSEEILSVETLREFGTMKTLNLENIHVILVTFRKKPTSVVLLGSSLQYREEGRVQGPITLLRMALNVTDVLWVWSERLTTCRFVSMSLLVRCSSLVRILLEIYKHD